MNMKRTIAATLLAASMLAGVIVPASAAPRTAVINVAYGITLEFNEQEVQLTDAKGRKVEPFVSNGTTYVPIRAISELFGAAVSYDGSTNTAYIYDDYSEISAIVYAMTSRASEALYAMDLEFGYAWSTKDFSQYKEGLQYCYSRLSKAGKAAETARQDNEDIELMETIEYDFAQFTATFIDTYNKFVKFDAERTKENYDAVSKGIGTLLLQNGVLRSDADKFFYDYSCWRDLELFD